MTASKRPGNTNRVKQLYESGSVAFGTYVTLPTPSAVEVAALSGFDFARMDPYHVAYNNETLQDMIRAAYAHGITPWVRVRNDPWAIMMTLDLGAQVVTIPNVESADAARAAVASTYYPPFGEREMSRPLRFRDLSAREYLDWVSENVLLSCQIEGQDGLDNYEEIVKVDGVDIIQTGRGDLSLALGVPGEEFHPKVLEAEKRVVSAALENGKQVSLLHPITEDGIERARDWINNGVLIMTVDSEYRVLMREYGAALNRLKGNSN